MIHVVSGDAVGRWWLPLLYRTRLGHLLLMCHAPSCHPSSSLVHLWALYPPPLSRFQNLHHIPVALESLHYAEVAQHTHTHTGTLRFFPSTR